MKKENEMLELEKELSIKKDISIDETVLDVEWLNQPSLMFRYSKLCADAKKVMDFAKEKIDTIRATVGKDVRTSPTKYGIEKATESAIESAIVLNEEYRKAVDEYIERKYEYEVLSGVVKALEQKKTALENLVRLLGLSYFAGPAVPHDLTKARDEFTQRNANKIVANYLNDDETEVES